MECLCSSSTQFCFCWDFSQSRGLLLRPSVVVIHHAVFDDLAFEVKLVLPWPLGAAVKFATAKHLQSFRVNDCVFFFDGVLLVLFVESVKRDGL